MTEADPPPFCSLRCLPLLSFLKTFTQVQRPPRTEDLGTSHVLLGGGNRFGIKPTHLNILCPSSPNKSLTSLLIKGLHYYCLSIMFGYLFRAWSLWAVWGPVTRRWHLWGCPGSFPGDSEPLTDFSLSMERIFILSKFISLFPSATSTPYASLNPKIFMIPMGPSRTLMILLPPGAFYRILLPGYGTFYLWIRQIQTHLNWGSAHDRVDGTKTNFLSFCHSTTSSTPFTHCVN